MSTKQITVHSRHGSDEAIVAHRILVIPPAGAESAIFDDFIVRRITEALRGPGPGKWNIQRVKHEDLPDDAADIIAEADEQLADVADELGLPTPPAKLTDKQRQWLQDLVDGKNPRDRYGSKTGAASGVAGSLMTRGLLTRDDQITAAGRAALAAPAAEPSGPRRKVSDDLE